MEPPGKLLQEPDGENDGLKAVRGKDPKLATLQVLPAEDIVRPGQTIALRVNGFDAAGEKLDIAPDSVRLEVRGPATIEGRTLTINADAGHEAVWVTARNTEGGADGSADQEPDQPSLARFRVVPPLPWHFDFSDGQIPVTWIGARYRHEARVVDGEPVLVKISTIPKGTRSQTWFGPTNLHDYTITADVRAIGKDKLPDMGVIAQRYVMDMMGESQKLQIRTWAAQLRMAQDKPLPTEANLWYTIKLRATTQPDMVLLEGKVWPRGDAEPAEWTLTATDPSPNRVGSPGLFGNATNAEILIDNVTVVAND